MTVPLPIVFAFEEADHLTRIHVKLALEDVGFAVCEEDETISIAASPEPAATGDAVLSPDASPASPTASSPR